MRVITKEKLKGLALLLIVMVCFACAGTSGSAPASEEKKQPPPTTTLQSVQQAKPLDARFSDILVNELTATDVIKKDYPAALADLESSLISHLRSKKAYARVAHNSGNAPLENTLLVNLTIRDMRIASSSARYLGGPFAGYSFMNFELELVDGASGESLRKEVMYGTNSSMGGAFSMGASDRSLPSDMGILTAEYIYTVARPLDAR